MPKKSRVQLKILALRKRLWPDLKPRHLWNRNIDDGFTSIPRTLPLITTIIDDLTKNMPAGTTYFELWCRAYDEMYVSLGDAAALATYSGYTGQRHVRTWQIRVKLLAELGFIRIAPGASGPLSHAVILNPHLVIKGLHDAKAPGLSAEKFTALQERAIAIGSLDFEEEEEEKREDDAAEAKEEGSPRRAGARAAERRPPLPRSPLRRRLGPPSRPRSRCPVKRHRGRPPPDRHERSCRRHEPLVREAPPGIGRRTSANAPSTIRGPVQSSNNSGKTASTVVQAIHREQFVARDRPHADEVDDLLQGTPWWARRPARHRSDSLPQT